MQTEVFLKAFRQLPSSSSLSPLAVLLAAPHPIRPGQARLQTARKSKEGFLSLTEHLAEPLRANPWIVQASSWVKSGCSGMRQYRGVGSKQSETMLLPSCQLGFCCQSQLPSGLPKRQEEVSDLDLHLSAEILAVLWMCNLSLQTRLITAVSLGERVGELRHST